MWFQRCHEMKSASSEIEQSYYFYNTFPCIFVRGLIRVTLTAQPYSVQKIASNIAASAPMDASEGQDFKSIGFIFFFPFGVFPGLVPPLYCIRSMSSGTCTGSGCWRIPCGRRTSTAGSGRRR
jgi:hypothetical protein